MSRKAAERTHRGALPSWRWRWLAAPLALAAVFLLKLTVLLQLGDHPLLQPDSGVDSVLYARLAGEVSSGNTALGPGLYAVAPLYIYFLALAVNLAAGSIDWVRVVQIGLGTAAVALVFRTACLWHGRRAAWIAGGLVALTGPLTFHEILPLPAALDPFLAALALCAAAEAFGRAGKAGPAPRLWTGVALPLGAGAAFGLAALNRPTVLVAAAGIVLVLLIQRRWRLSLAMLAGLLVMLLPLLVRNYAVARDLAPLSSHGGMDFFIGNNAEADGTYRMPRGMTASVRPQEESHRVAEAAVGRRLDDGDVSAYFYGQGWNWIAGNPAAALTLFLRKLALAFNAAHPSPNYSYSYYAGDERSLLTFLAVGPWLLVPLGLLGLWLGAPGDPDRRGAFAAWASFVPFYALGLAVFFVSSRHRLPLLVPLAVSAGAAVDALSGARWRRAMAARPLRAGVGAALLAGTAVLANWPLRVDDGRVEERTRMALWLIGQERYAEAETRLTGLARDHAEPALLHFRAGRAYLAKGQPEPAVRHLEQSRAADAGRPETDYALGQALLDAQRAKEAIPHLRRAFDAGVRPDLVGYDLARAYGAAGDRANAVRVLQRVRPARRDDADSWRLLGELALALEAPRLSEAFLRQSLEARPDSAPVYEQLGLAVALSGRYEEAIRSFERSVQLDPANASAQLNLAVAYAEVGRTREARARAQESLRLNPGYDKARTFLEAIKNK